MTPPNLTPQGADVALDPMAGTLAGTGRIAYSPDFQSEKPATARVLQANGLATPHESSVSPYGGRTALQCQARGCDGCLVCASRSTDFLQVDQKSAGGAGTAPDSFARAGTGNTMAEVVASLDPNPWAEDEDGAQSSMVIPESRATAGSGVAPSVGLNINILALDLGAKTGWALRRRDSALLHGTEDFTPRASWAPGQKWQRFRAWLSATVMHHNITQIAFEDVKGHGSGQVLAAHAYGGFRAMLEMVADQHRITLVPLGVGQIKKHWTGSGVAKKDAMVMQAKARGYRVLDDNNADALAILHLAIAREQGEWAAPRTKPKRTRKAGAVAQERAA